MKLNIEIFFSKKDFAKALFVIGFFPIVFALISQYGFGLHPCELCIYQRIPFAVVSVLGFLLIFIKNECFGVTAKLFSALAFIVNSGLAFYHVGVEKHWWSYGDCSSTLDVTSLESLKKALFEAPTVRCDEVQFELLSISMAGWNIIYSLAAAIFIIYITFIKKDNHSDEAGEK